MTIRQLNAASSYLQGLEFSKELAVRAERGKRRMENGDVSYEYIKNVFDELLFVYNKLNKIKDIPGVLEINTNENISPTYNIQVDFPALIAAIIATLDLIVAGVPQASGWNTVSILEVDYTTTYRQFNSVGTVPIQDALQIIVDAVSEVPEPAEVP
jgi:hypothetical protein